MLKGGVNASRASVTFVRPLRATDPELDRAVVMVEQHIGLAVGLMGHDDEPQFHDSWIKARVTFSKSVHPHRPPTLTTQARPSRLSSSSREASG